METLKLFSMCEAAAYLNIRAPTLSKYIKQGLVKPYAKSDSGRCVFTQSQLDALKPTIETNKGARRGIAPPDSGLIPIGVFSAMTGIKTHQLRYWDKTGILKPADKTERGERLYSQEQLDTLQRELKSTEVR